MPPKIILLETGGPRSGKTHHVIKRELAQGNNILICQKTNNGVNDIAIQIEELGLPILLLPLRSREFFCPIYRRLKEKYSSETKIEREYRRIRRFEEQELEKYKSEIDKRISDAASNGKFCNLALIAEEYPISTYITQFYILKYIVKKDLPVVIVATYDFFATDKRLLAMDFNSLIWDECRHIPDLNIKRKATASFPTNDLNVLKKELFDPLDEFEKVEDEQIRLQLLQLRENFIAEIEPLTSRSSFRITRMNRGEVRSICQKLERRGESYDDIVDVIKQHILFFLDEDADYYIEVVQEYELIASKKSRVSPKYHLAITKVPCKDGEEIREPFASTIMKTPRVVLIDATPFPIEWHNWVLGITNFEIECKIKPLTQEFRVIVDGNSYGVSSQWEHPKNRIAMLRFIESMPITTTRFVGRSKREKELLQKYLPETKIDYLRSAETQSVDIKEEHLVILGTPKKPRGANWWREKSLKKMNISLEEFNEHEERQSLTQAAFRNYSRVGPSGVVILNLKNPNADMMRCPFAAFPWYDADKIKYYPLETPFKLLQSTHIEQVVEWCCDLITNKTDAPSPRGYVRNAIKERIIAWIKENNTVLFTKKLVARTLSLDDGKVSTVIDTLVREGILQEIKERAGKGRPKVTYRLQPDKI